MTLPVRPVTSTFSGDPESARDPIAALIGPATQGDRSAMCALTEIAAMTGAAEETVRSRLRLGKQALRANIERNDRLRALRETIVEDSADHSVDNSVDRSDMARAPMCSTSLGEKA